MSFVLTVQKTIEESYLPIRMSHIVTIITSVICGFFCISGCVFCRKECKKSREPEEEILVFTPVEKVPKENPLVVGADLASENIDCSICLESYEVGQKLAVLSCMHFYHDHCLRTWNKDHGECPQCRENINVVIID